MAWAITSGCLGLTATGSDAAPAVSDAEKTQVVRLEYQEVPVGSIVTFGTISDAVSQPLKQVPDLGKHKVLRHWLNFGGEDSARMAFVWDQTSNVLYLDLNRNMDLTDDPSGVVTNVVAGQRFARFADIRVDLPFEDGIRPLMLDLTFYSFGSRLNVQAGVRSFWQGKLAVQDREFQVGVVEQCFVKQRFSHFILRPWAEREKPLNLDSVTMKAFDFPEQLFLMGQLYGLDCKYEIDAKPRSYRLALREKPVQLGELSLTGQNVDRLLLISDSCTVVLDQPKSVELVPVGNYTRQKVWLKSGTTEAGLGAYYRGDRTITVTGGNKPTLALGGPLTNSVSIAKRGKTLVFTYELQGADGAVYSLANQDRAHPPEFVVYQGDRKVHSGKFEFG